MTKNFLSVAFYLAASTCIADDAWVIDSQDQWSEHLASKTELKIQDGLAVPTAETATFRSKLKRFAEKRSASSITFDQSPIWQNWNPIDNVGPVNLGDAPVALSLGPNNYWMFGRYNARPRGAKRNTPIPKFTAEPASLAGFDAELTTTRFPNQYDAPGGRKKKAGGYHAWQSRDMVNWVHHGSVTTRTSAWVTTAEYVDGKAYIYYDFPNDQDPHLWIDDDLFDGQPGENMGMAFEDPSHGSDCGVIRDLDGKFHIIYENWDPISANKRSWDSPLAGHTVSDDGITFSKILAPAVDERTKPTGKMGTYRHPHWLKEDPDNYETNVAEYEIHEPEQEAFGDWAAICVGGQYYLFGDYDPVGGHKMAAGWFTASSLDEKFAWCDKIGVGHPDPDVCFAEGKFYLITQMSTDYTSPGPWVEKVETRVGVDTSNDGKVDQWTNWQEASESYDYMPGFARQIEKAPASIDLSSLPAGYGFQFEVRLTDTTENKSKPILDKVTLSFAEPSNGSDAAAAGSSPQIGPYDGTWESLQNMPIPAWFDDGKIGIFIHWGPYSAIGYRKKNSGYAEHVPRLIYSDTKHYYPYLQKRWGAAPPELGYKDIVSEFKAENWNPDSWAKLFTDVGARYVVVTAEHHDGYANWDSDLTPWNAVDTGPKRDLVGDLAKAVRKQGLKFSPSYHRERHTGFFAQEMFKVSSPAHPDIAAEIQQVPAAASLYGPFSYSKEFVDDYVARWKELQDKYQPDFMWIDDVPIFTRDGNNPKTGFRPEIQYFYDQCCVMITDFMNNAASRGQEVYLNNKGGNLNWPAGVGCREKDNLKLKQVGPKWQSCTTFGGSFGYMAAEENPKHRGRKSIESVIHEMVEVVSRNGNFLINIGPRGDGTIPEWQVERLRAMGDWLDINGEAIYGTRYWKTDSQRKAKLVFTKKQDSLFAIKLEKPEQPFTVTSTADWRPDQVESVRLLGSEEKVSWKSTSRGIRITPPKDTGKSKYAWAFEIATTEAL